ncbi:MAG TPA: hypothetical protein VNS09_08275 [Solirubrobacter sp.]|nr:hypothetical protein [Solirubrobacter sp.]
MQFGRVLALVAGAFALCLAVLVVVVVLARDEGAIQSDLMLSENITRAIATQPEVRLDQVAGFDWDRVLIVQPGTPRAAISKRLGREWTGIDTIDGGELLIFLRGGDVARFADYRGSYAWEGFSRPFTELPRSRAVLHVRDRVVRP